MRKFSKPKRNLKNCLEAVTGYLVNKKKKDKAEKIFVIIPSLENYQNTLNKQNEYEKFKEKEKLKHKNKIVKNMR